MVRMGSYVTPVLYFQVNEMFKVLLSGYCSNSTSMRTGK